MWVTVTASVMLVWRGLPAYICSATTQAGMSWRGARIREKASRDLLFNSDLPAAAGAGRAATAVRPANVQDASVHPYRSTRCVVSKRP